MNNPDTAEVVRAMTMQLVCTPRDFELLDLKIELDLDRQPLYGRGSTA